jgi:hypothetical protein
MDSENTGSNVISDYDVPRDLIEKLEFYLRVENTIGNPYARTTHFYFLDERAKTSGLK